MEKDYGEILCTAIDEIVSTRLQGLKYDITKQCTIKDDSRAHQGRYVVSDGGSRFEAFSLDTSFKNGNSVLVTIPNGDFTMQKTIVGRIASVDTTPFKYVSPLDSMIKIRDGMLENIEINETGLLANRKPYNSTMTEYGSMIECFTVPADIAKNSSFAGYTRLGISADFKSIFNGYEVVEGSYGIKILIYADVMTSPGEIDKEGVWELTFSSEEMVGNPYQFPTYFQQEKVFDISDIANIREIKVYFYENGNFKDIHGEYIPDKFTTALGPDEYLLNNLFVNNFKFYFGYELERYAGETIELYPENSTMTYHHSRQNELKTIGLRWIHQDEDGTMGLLEGEELFKPKKELDGLPEFEIKWFRYNFGHPVIDTHARVNWEHITECTNYIILNNVKIEDYEEEKDYIKDIRDIVINNPNKIYAYLDINNLYIDFTQWPDEGFPSGSKFFEKITFSPTTDFTFAPNVNLQTEKIKAIGFIRKKNGIELDKTAIETAGGCYISPETIQDYWDMYFNYKELPTDKQPIPPEERYNKQEDGTYEQTEDNSGNYVKLTYEQIVGLQSKVSYTPHRTDDGTIIKLEKKTNAQYLEDLEAFIKLFTYCSAYILDPYYSRELILTNEEKVIDQLTYDAATALRIVCEDGSEGNYLIYDQNGKLKNEGQGKGYERNFKLTYKGRDIDLAFEQLDDIDWVEWYLPSDAYDVRTSTMLSIPNSREHTSRLELDGVDYLCFKYTKEYVPVVERYPDFNQEIFKNGKYYIQSTVDTSQYLEIKEWNPSKYTYYEYRFAKIMQPYSIKNEWIESASNNFVRVAMSINGNVFDAIEEMRFGKGGSNGTNATFLLEFLENVNALEAIKGKQIKVKARLYEGHTEIAIPNRDLMADSTWLKWKFNLSKQENFIEILPWKTDKNGDPIYESGKPTLYKEISEEERRAVDPIIIYNNEYVNQNYEVNAKYYIKDSDGSISIEKTFKNEAEFIAYIGYNPSIRYLKFIGENSDVTEYFKNNFHILQGTYKWNNINLVAYLSIPLKFNSSNINISHIEGAKEVNYNHQGQPSYYANPYKVFKKATPYEEIKDVTWEINNPEEIKDDKARVYIPSLKEKDGKYMFVPSVYYAEGAQNKICIYCKKETNYYWSQPILIYKHRYDFDILNSWNGGLQTDEANGTIMANMFGAGRKNEDNTFSGVMMGDMAKGTGNDSAYAETGIYGLYKGDVSFALKDNGTATFGVANRGQIHINGNESTITSSGYDDKLGGMKIDLDDGIIDIRESDSKKLDGTDYKEGLYLRSRDGTNLISIDRTEQILQSNKYDKDTIGMYINLGAGELKMIGEEGSVLLQKKSPYLTINGPSGTETLMSVGTEGYYLQSYNFHRRGSKEEIKNSLNQSIYYDSELSQYVSLKTEEVSGKDKWIVNIYDILEKAYVPQENISPKIKYIKTENNINQAYELSLYQVNVSTNKYFDYFTNDYITSSNLIEDVQYKIEIEAMDKETLTENKKKELCMNIIEGRISQFMANIGNEPYGIESKGTGLHLDLQNGQIEGYDLSIKAFKSGSDNKHITIESNAEDYPLAIGGRFKITWDGECYIKYLSNTVGSYDSKYAFNISDRCKITTNGNKLYVNNKDILQLIEKAQDTANSALSAARNAAEAAEDAAGAASTVASNLSAFKTAYNQHGHTVYTDVTGAPSPKA